MIKVSIEEAIGVINEWGVDCDNFVAHNYRQYMNGGNPSDDSMEKAQYFMECLRLVCNLGIEAYNNGMHRDLD